MTSSASMLLAVALVVVVPSVAVVFSMDDIFSMFVMSFGGHGGSWRLRRWRTSSPNYRGSDLRLRFVCRYKRLLQALPKKFKVRKDVPCEHCHGTGAERWRNRNLPELSWLGR